MTVFQTTPVQIFRLDAHACGSVGIIPCPYKTAVDVEHILTRKNIFPLPKEFCVSRAYWQRINIVAIRKSAFV